MAGGSILVVDDDPDALEICSRVLRSGGYRVERATSSGEAMESVLQDKFDLVLADIEMAELDGLQTVQSIKRADPGIVTVAMIGHASMETAVKALRMGVEDFLIKPFSVDELREVIASALEKERLRRDNARLRALIPLYELSKIFMSVTKLDELLDEIVQVSCQETDAGRVSLMLVGKDGETMTIEAAIGLPREVIETTMVRLGEGIAGRVALEREPLVLDKRLPLSEDLLRLMKQDEISSAICIPLTVRSELIGVLNLSKFGDDAEPFTQSDVDLTSVLAGQAAIAIKNAHLFEEIKQAYKDLQRLDKLKSEFINVAAHELRTPLAILLGYAELLEHQMGEANRKYVRSIVHNALRLKKLVTDMLNLRYLEAGEMELQLQQLQLSEVVGLVVEDLGFLIEGKAQQLSIEIPEGFPSIWADKDKLRLILSSLLSNATKFTPQGGQIRVSASMEKDHLKVAVSDTGIGIPAEEHQTIFDSFYQIEDSLRREHQGLGLGLSIVRGLVELHQGRVWVESRVGEGSTFYFTVSRHLGPQPQSDQT